MLYIIRVSWIPWFHDCFNTSMANPRHAWHVSWKCIGLNGSIVEAVFALIDAWLDMNAWKVFFENQGKWNFLACEEVFLYTVSWENITVLHGWFCLSLWYYWLHGIDRKWSRLRSIYIATWPNSLPFSIKSICYPFEPKK